VRTKKRRKASATQILLSSRIPAEVLKTGADAVITIFGDFWPVFCEKMAFLFKKQCYDPNFPLKIAVSRTKTPIFFKKNFGENIFKIKTFCFAFAHEKYVNRICEQALTVALAQSFCICRLLLKTYREIESLHTYFLAKVSRFFFTQSTKKIATKLSCGHKLYIPMGQIILQSFRMYIHRLYQSVSFHGPPKLTQRGNFGLKIYHLATLHLYFLLHA
jgi:hypothetical protein